MRPAHLKLNFGLKYKWLSPQRLCTQIDMTEDQAYHYSKEMMAIDALLPDAKEGFIASIEKREPKFPEE